MVDKTGNILVIVELFKIIILVKIISFYELINKRYDAPPERLFHIEY